MVSRAIDQKTLLNRKRLIEFPLLSLMQIWNLSSIGLVGDFTYHGNSTLAKAIAHVIHKYSKAPFTIRVFTAGTTMEC